VTTGGGGVTILLCDRRSAHDGESALVAELAVLDVLATEPLGSPGSGPFEVMAGTELDL
jgi:hypothetical protein